MTTANWITILITLVTVGAGAGGALVSARIGTERLKALEKAFTHHCEKEGLRAGEAEQRIATLEGGEPRAPTRSGRRTRPIPITPPEES